MTLSMTRSYYSWAAMLIVPTASSIAASTALELVMELRDSESDSETIGRALVDFWRLVQCALGVGRGVAGSVAADMLNERKVSGSEAGSSRSNKDDGLAVSGC